MDLSVSPDLDAYYCYAIVLIAGLLTGTQQIHKRLGTIEGLWFVWRTWLLFALYTIMPVLLFWVLDWSNAVNDTSLFAALLIGFGYERILAGNNESISAPGPVSALWSPLLAYSDTVVEKVRTRVARNRARFEELVVKLILSKEERYDQLDQLARTRSGNTTELEQDLTAIDQNQTVASDAKREQVVRRLYEEVSLLPDYRYLLKEKKITTGMAYYWYAREWRSKTIGLFIGGIVVAALFGVYWSAVKSDSCVVAEYYIWRFEKANATATDLERARQGLSEEMTAPDRQRCVIARMNDLLRNPGLPAERLDRALQFLLEHRRTIATGNAELAAMLVEALRNDNVDARERTQSALVFLAEENRSDSPGEIKAWNPSKGNSVPDLERRINEWRVYWSLDPPP